MQVVTWILAPVVSTASTFDLLFTAAVTGGRILFAADLDVAST